MGFLYSTYFGLVRINNTGPEAKNWAVTDYNPELTSKIMYSLSRHTHGGATPAHYPGYNYATPATPTLIKVVEAATPTAGVLAPGTSIGVRLSYLDATGLETEASPEALVTLGSVPVVANAPVIGTPTSTPVPGAMRGGVYLYGITKGLGGGETELSGTALVEVPYPNDLTSSYTVDVTFDPIADYDDGTDTLKIYRSEGIGSAFSLVKTWTQNLATPGLLVTYTDAGSLENAAKTPPTVTSFNRNKVVQITTAGISHPAEMATLRVYITQIPGVYGTNHLLEEVDLATPTGPNPSTPVKNTFNYLGSESLSAEYPKEFSQLPTLPGKINLGTETYGGLPPLTSDLDFNNQRANRFLLPSGLSNAATPSGAMYYDSSSRSVKFNVNGSWVTLATPTGSFVHSADETGGHTATKIYYGPSNLGLTVEAVLNTLTTPVYNDYRSANAAARPTTWKTLTNAAIPFTASSLTSLMALASVPIKPAYAGQWLEIVFTGDLSLVPPTNRTSTATLQFEINSSTSAGAETSRSATAAATPVRVPVHIYFATPISSNLTTLRVMGSVSTGGSASFAASRASIYAKLLP